MRNTTSPGSLDGAAEISLGDHGASRSAKEGIDTEAAVEGACAHGEPGPGDAGQCRGNGALSNSVVLHALDNLHDRFGLVVNAQAHSERAAASGLDLDSDNDRLILRSGIDNSWSLVRHASGGVHGSDGSSERCELGAVANAYSTKEQFPLVFA